MGESCHGSGVDREVARLASSRHGVISGDDLARAGLTPGGVKHRLRTGRLHRLYPGVYAVGHTALTQEGRWLAAVMACGPGSVLASFSAAALWGMRAAGDEPVHVTRARSHRRAPAGVVLRRAGSLPLTDVSLRAGIPVTAPARTLLDLATVAAQRELGAAVEQAQILGLVAPDELLARSRNRPGATALRAALASEPSLSRSDAERRLFDIIRRAGLPRPLTNVRIGAYEVDAYWPAQRVVVEVDGFAYHRHRAAFERDRVRDATLQARGIRVMRVTWHELTARPERVVAHLATLLAPT